MLARGSASAHLDFSLKRNQASDEFRFIQLPFALNRRHLLRAESSLVFGLLTGPPPRAVDRNSPETRGLRGPNRSCRGHVLSELIETIRRLRSMATFVRFCH